METPLPLVTGPHPEVVPAMSETFDPNTFGAAPESADELLARYAQRLPELAIDPGLLAAVDQHAAALRDTLGGEDADAVPGGLREVLLRTLDDYVLGFTDALGEIGWTPHDGYDFAGLRLTAVCWLRREYALDFPA